MVFLVVMYRCESWTIKKAEAKELMLSNFGAGEDPESPLDCKEIKPANSLEKTLMLGKREGRRRRV